MKFLSKLGSILQAGLYLFTGFKPLLDTVAPKTGDVTTTISKDLTEIANEVTLVEQVGQALALPGAQKLTAAAGPVAQVILASAVFAGKPIANPDLFNAGASKIASGMADCLNSLHESVAQSMVVKAQS